MQQLPKPVFDFGPFRLDANEQRLLRGPRPVPLTPKAFELLLCLIEARGRLLTKQDLLNTVWPGAFVEESVLTVHMSAVRKALGDDRNGHSYIETVPRRGYRFVAQVKTKTQGAAEPANLAVRSAGLGRKKLWVGLAVLTVVVGARLLLDRWSAHPATETGRIMLAVLPFENLSGDPEDEFLSDGVTEEMITQLAYLNPEEMAVIARTSSMRYKRSGKEITQIGRELGVDYVLEGSMRRAGERVRISAQLIKVSDRTHLWAENYEGDLHDILALQAQVATAIAREVRLKLTPEGRSRLNSRPFSPQAHELYLKGRYFWNKRTRQGFETALSYFQQAIEKDPNYALAHVGLADTYILLGYYSLLPPQQAYPAAKAAALKALEINPALGEAHASLAGVFMDYEWKWEEVEHEYGRALALNPGYSVAHQWYGNYLSAMGRFAEAIHQIQRARELDPLSMIVNTNLGWAYHLARRHDEAIAEGLKAVEMDSNFYWAHLLLGRAYEAKNMHRQAIGAFERASALSPDNPMVLADLGHAYATAGRRADAEAILARLKQMAYQPPFEIALICLGLGQYDEAFAWLEKSYQQRARSLGFAGVEPRLDPLRSDPRFHELLGRMKLLPPANSNRDRLADR